MHRTLLATLAMSFCLPLWALEAPSKVLVPTLAYDDQQIILAWEKPAHHADIIDYHAYTRMLVQASRDFSAQAASA